MVAYDPRRSSDGRTPLSDPTSTSLLEAMRLQRGAGRVPLPALNEAIQAAAREARETATGPENLIIQLKLIAEQAGLPPMMGDEETNAIREWMVSACIQAYFAAGSPE